MCDNPYKSPDSNTIAHGLSLPAPIKLPWTRWIIAVQILLTFGIYTNTIATTISYSNIIEPQLLEVIKTGGIIITLVLMFGVATLRRGIIIFSGFAFLLIGTLKINENIHWFADSPAILPAILAILIYVAPNIFAAWYLLRPSFLDLSAQHRKHQDTLSMQKYVLKKLTGK